MDTRVGFARVRSGISRLPGGADSVGSRRGRHLSWSSSHGDTDASACNQHARYQDRLSRRRFRSDRHADYHHPVAAALGWRAAFWFTGAFGALWLALWSLVSRRRDLARPTAIPESHTRPRWHDTQLWAFIGAYALGASPTAYVFYVAPIYLSEALHKSQVEIGHVLWIPPLGSEIGFLFWGWVTDRLVGRGSSLPALRRQFLVLMLLSLPLAAVPHIGSYRITIAMLFLAMFVVAGFVTSALAYATWHYSIVHSGLLAGVGSGTWSAVVALFMPVVGRLFDLHRYNAAFALATLLPVAGYVVWRTLHSGTDPMQAQKTAAENNSTS